MTDYDAWVLRGPEDHPSAMMEACEACKSTGMIAPFALALLIVASPGAAATIADMTTSDILGYACIAEADLDAAFALGGKGGVVPQTCLPLDPPKDCLTLTPLMGRPATYDECATYAYRWLSWTDPERETGWGWGCDDCRPPPPSPVPLPATAWLLLAALAGLFLWRKQ